MNTQEAAEQVKKLCDGFDFYGAVIVETKAQREALRVLLAAVEGKQDLNVILEKDGICICENCRHCGTGSEFTVSNYPSDDYSACCPKCGNDNEDCIISAESLSEKLARHTGSGG